MIRICKWDIYTIVMLYGSIIIMFSSWVGLPVEVNDFAVRLNHEVSRTIWTCLINTIVINYRVVGVNIIYTIGFVVCMRLSFWRMKHVLIYHVHADFTQSWNIIDWSSLFRDCTIACHGSIIRFLLVRCGEIWNLTFLHVYICMIYSPHFIFCATILNWN